VKKTLNIFNHYHNGDVFYSRSLVQQLMKNYNIVFYHNLNHGLFKDLPNVTEIKGVPQEFKMHTLIDGNNINSWIGAGEVTDNCSFYSYLTVIKKVFNHFGMDFNKDEIPLPSVNYENLENKQLISDIIFNFKKEFNIIVLISTGSVNSGQSINFDFSNIVDTLSTLYTNVLFITTTEIPTQKHNVVYSGNITKIIPDLLEISYISSFCDIVVGRASGPYCFSQTNENMNDENKTFISFCNLEIEGNFYHETKSKKIWSNNYEFDNILNTIGDEINKKIKNIQI
jgi:hypothetical protein